MAGIPTIAPGPAQAIVSSRALGAVKHSMLIAYWHMFTNGETYRDLGGDYYARRDPERATKRLIAKLHALGHDVTLQPAAA